MNLTRVVQRFDNRCVSDVGGAVRLELEKLASRIAPGASIAVAVGSRGIGDLEAIVRATATWLKERGARPFIVPAMGSHGGATAEGQQEVLASYGIDEPRTGAPVRSSMDVVPLDSTGSPARLYMDALAWRSDGVILVNRIKPHSDFHGTYESGLVKMAVIGLGKHEQAKEIHGFGVKGLKEILPQCGRRLFATGKVLGGLAIVENAYGRPAVISCLPAERIMEAEPGLLEKARRLSPSLPVEELDLLVVDYLGKDVSGTGMDPWVIGRLAIQGEKEPARPRIRVIVARDITPASGGNALGVGFADVTTRRLYRKIDFSRMYENVFTSAFLQRAKIPVIAENDRQAIELGLRACGRLGTGEDRVMRIRDTLRLGELYVSPAIVSELSRSGAGRSPVEITGPEIPLFGPDGDCPDRGVWQEPSTRS